MEKNKVESGRYLILKQIGKGGTSRVYKAKDIKTGEIFALKRFVGYNLCDSKRLMEDLDRELDVLKYKLHPCLPKVFNIIKKNNDFYLVMEYIEGKSLEEVHLCKKQWSKIEVIDIAKQLLSVMYYLHSLEPPIIYRDLKPENIIMQDNGKIKLIDFGNAKKFNRDITVYAKAYGTPKFAAPEQYGDREGRGLYNTDIRTDIYGVGAVLYYLASGYKIGEKVSCGSKAIYLIRFGRKFDNIIRKATRTYPKDRYSDDIEMLTEICNL